jgi:hypothetical protein
MFCRFVLQLPLSIMFPLVNMIPLLMSMPAPPSMHGGLVALRFAQAAGLRAVKKKGKKGKKGKRTLAPEACCECA